jgi:glycosyltransferase involved in cell wall biosynthesis
VSVRVLHIDCGRELRGGQRQVLLLMKGLREAGHESTLLARQNGPLWQAAVEADFVVHDTKLRNVRKYSERADVVHAHDARSHTAAALLVKRGFVVSRRVAFPVGRTRIARWKYGRAARFLAVSQCAADELLAAGVPAGKIDVVFDGIESAACAAGWRVDYPAVALASADPRKGRDLVEEASAAAGIPVHYSSDLERDLRHASMFVYITRSEGLGSAALLAMSMGIPVVASRVGGLPEAIVDGESGILVSNESAGIARAMRRVIENSALTQALIANARLRVATLFSRERLVDGTLAAYRRVLA